MKDKKGLSSFLLLTLVVFLSACNQITTTDPSISSENQESSESSETKVEMAPREYIAINENNTFITLNPTKFMTSEELKVGSMIYEGLFQYTSSGEVVAGVIENDFEVIDGHTVRATIKDSAKWSDGEAVKAEDFILSWQNLINPSNKNYYSFLLNNTVVNAEEIAAGNLDSSQLGVRAIDEKTIEISLESLVSEYQSLQTLFAFPALSPVPSHLIKASQLNDYGLAASEVVSNGPYIINSWNSNWETWIYTKNYEYWNENVYDPTKISVQVTNSNNETQLLLDNQYIDIANLQSQESLDQSIYLQFNTYQEKIDTATPFADQRVREAVAKSINLAEIIKTYDKDVLVLTDSIIPGAKESSSYNTYDIETANQLISEYLKEKDYDAIEIELTYIQGELNEAIASEIQKQINQNLNGVSLNLRELPLGIAEEELAQQNYDFTLKNVKQWNKADDFIDLSQFSSNNPANNTGFISENFDELIQGNSFARTVEDDVINSAEDILTQNYIVAPLFQTGHTTLINQSIKGLNEKTFSIYEDFSDVMFQPGTYTIPKSLDEAEE